MDLREKLKNLAKDPEAMAREIELAGEKKSLLADDRLPRLPRKLHRRQLHGQLSSAS